MRIGIFGAGYVGLSTAVCFAQKHDIALIDIDPSKVTAINNNQPYIFEKDLDNLLSNALKSRSLKAMLINETFQPFDMIFITVGTPAENDGYINLQFVRDVAKTLFQYKKEFLFDNQQTLIVLRSTVIPGTTNQILGDFEKQKLAKIASNPEFLAQGSAIHDTLHPKRIIIGTNQEAAYRRLEDFYSQFYQDSGVPILHMSIESAEFTKYIANAFLAMKISFANEIADLVQHIRNSDIDDIMKGIGLDPRISPYFLRAGIGFGGSCFPKDVQALISFSENLAAETPRILSSVLKVNENRPYRLIKILREELGELNNSKIAVLGLSFKPGTNDVRDAPSISIIQALWRAGARIGVHDPLITRIDLRAFKRFNIIVSSSVEECLRGADACLLLTEWPEYSNLELDDIVAEMRQKIIIDGRRVFVDRQIPLDIRYITIGSFPEHHG
ncbi:MAG: UDP-glucose dehydrogenase family protein [Candidatus Hodarchaeota archaeon]